MPKVELDDEEWRNTLWVLQETPLPWKISHPLFRLAMPGCLCSASGSAEQNEKAV